MTKLEQKLIELGYRYKDLTYSGYLFSRMYNEIETQQDIDNLQQAFDQLQSDLKELKEC